MAENKTAVSTIIDFVTGESAPNIGAEANRQAFERFLVNDRGYRKEDIAVDVDIQLDIDGEIYRSQIDLVVSTDGMRVMAVKCAVGSLGSWEREILAAARLLDLSPIPLAVVSDGLTAIILDTMTGKKIGEGLQAVPTRNQVPKIAGAQKLEPLPPERIKREKLIFRSYDSMNINVRRNFSS